LVNTTIKEVTNPVAGQDGDHAGGTDWNQMAQVLKGTHSTERVQSSSIQKVTWVTKSAASQTLLVTEEYVLVDATSNAVTVFLEPAASNLNGHHCIKRVDNALTNLVTVDANGSETIDGALIIILAQRGQALDIVSDGANWRVSDPLDVTYQMFRAKGGTLNRWYTYELNVNTASTTSTVVAATMYAFPMIIPKITTIDSVALNVTTLGSSSHIQAGIYADNGNMYPGVLIQDLGNVDTSATGVKTFATGLPLTILPGLYWLAYIVQATAPVISGYAVTQLPPILGTTSALTVAHGVGWSVSQAYGAMPNPFTAGGTVITAVPCGALFWRTSG
jgi:hypothetical protein